VSIDAILEALRELDKASADTDGGAWVRRQTRGGNPSRDSGPAGLGLATIQTTLCRTKPIGALVHGRKAVQGLTSNSARLFCRRTRHPHPEGQI
jgi:hypothetical protein